MSSISNVGQLVAIIQAQMATRTGNTIVGRKTTQSITDQSGIYSPENLEALIGQRVKQIDPDDPKRGRKAFRVFLESILLSHFGEQLINDPKFYQLVEDVHISIEADSQLREMVDTAIALLLPKVCKR